jgi:hypothetical protein
MNDMLTKTNPFLFSKILALTMGLFFINPLALAEKSPTQSIIKSLAVVGTHYVTSRELIMSQSLESLLWSPTSKAPAKIKLANEISDKEISALLMEWVLFYEAEAFSVGKPSDEDIQNLLNQFEKNKSHIIEWNSLEVSSSELKELLIRKLTAKNFLKFKTELSGIQVDDEEARKYFDKNRSKFGNLPYSTFKENIKSYLSQKMMEDRTKDWFEVLKRKYKVSILQAGL